MIAPQWRVTRLCLRHLPDAALAPGPIAAVLAIVEWPYAGFRLSRITDSL